MLVKLQTLQTVALNCRRPLTKIRWLGQDVDVVHAFGTERISKVHLPTSRIKKRTKQLKKFEDKGLHTLNSSANGMIVIGVLKDGQLFLWNRNSDFVYSVASPCSGLDSDIAKGCCLQLFVSDSGDKVVLSRDLATIYVWHKPIEKDAGVWLEVMSRDEDSSFNLTSAADCTFCYNQLVGEATSLTIACKQTSGNCSLTLRQLLICWSDSCQVVLQCTLGGYNERCYGSDSNQTYERIDDKYLKDFGRAPFTASWSTQVLDVICSQRFKHSEANDGDCEFVLRYSPDGQILAGAVNRLNPVDSLIVFVSQLENVSTAVPFYQFSHCPEGSSGVVWHVSDMQWSLDCIFLACVTKRGALSLLTRFGEPVFIQVEDIGPSQHLPLHPLVFISTTTHVESKVLSPLRQSFSVAFHRSLNRLLISDGYGVTVLQFPSDWDSCSVVKNFCVEANKCLQQTVDLDVELQCHIREDKIHYPMDEGSITVNLNNRLADEQFTSTQELSVTASSYVLSDLSVSQGVVQFAGIDADSSGAGGSMDRKYFVKRLLAVLTTAWALILSDGKRRLESRDNGDVIFQRRSVSDAVCSWLLDVYGIAWGLCDESYKHLLLLEEEERISLFKSALSLVNLDAIRQQRLDLVLKMVRTFVTGELSSSSLNEDHIDDRLNLLSRIRELLLLADRVIAHSYNWHALGYTTGQEACGHLSCASDVFLPIMINSKSTGDDVSSLTHTRVPSCWNLIHREVKLLSAHLLSSKSSPKPDIMQSTVSEWNIQFVLKRSLELYAAVSGDIQRLGIDISSDKQSASEKYLEDRFEKQIETLRSGTVFSDSPSAQATGVSERQAYSNDDESNQMLSQLILYFYQYDIRSALLLLDSVLHVSCYYLNLSVSEDSSTLDELHTLRCISQARSGSGQKDTTPSELLDVLPVLAIKSPRGVKTVKCFAQLIAAYFANLPLLVAPAHCPAVSPSVSDLIQDVGCVLEISSRFSELSRDLVLESIKEQGVTDCWTVHLAVELLLACGLTNDAIWFVYKLGDWRTAFALSTILSHHIDLCKLGESGIDLQPHALVKESLERHTCVQEIKEKIDLFLNEYQNYQIQLDEDRLGRPHIERIYELVIDTDPEDFSPNCAKLENELHAAAVAGFDLMIYLANDLLFCLKRLVQQTSWKVAADFHLPAPPPFCPQSWILSQESSDQVVIETGFRLLVHIVVKALVSLLKSGSCLHSCTLSYIEQLKKLFVNESKSLSHTRAFRKSRAMLDDIVVLEASPILSIFRDFCGVLWLLHVRDQVIHYLRKSRKGWAEVQVSDGIQWFDCAFCFDQCLMDSDELKRHVLAQLLEVGDCLCVAEFIGRHFGDELGSLRESGYKRELKQLLERIKFQSNQPDIGSSSDVPLLFDSCKRKGDARALHLQAMKQQYATVNSLMGACLDVTSLADEWRCDVGSWECESYKIFAKYLNNSFEVMLAQGVVQTVHGSRNQIPFLASLQKLPKVSPACETSGKWPQLLPLVLWLQKWSDQGIRAGVTLEAKIERSHSSQSSIKVSMSVETIISTLLIMEGQCDHADEKNTNALLLEATFKQQEQSPMPISLQVDVPDKDETCRNTKSEGEVTIPSQLGSSLSINVTSFGEAGGKKTGDDDTLSSASMVSHHVDAAPDDFIEELDLLALNKNELLEEETSKLSNVTGAGMSVHSDILTQSAHTLPAEQHHSSVSSIDRIDEIPHQSISGSVVSSELTSEAEKHTFEVEKVISVTTGRKDDCEMHDPNQIQALCHDDGDDVASDKTFQVSSPGSNTVSEVTQLAHEGNFVVTTDLVEKQVTTVEEGNRKSSSLLPFSTQNTNEFEPLVMVTEAEVRQQSTETVCEITDEREGGLSQMRAISGHPATSGLVETVVVQQSLAQQPFSRNELHQILQAQKVYIEQIMTVVDNQNEQSTVNSTNTKVVVEPEKCQSKPNRAALEHFDVNTDSRYMSGKPHSQDVAHFLLSNVSDVESSQDDCYYHSGLNQSPLLYIDRSVLSDEPVIPQTAVMNDYSLTSGQDVLVDESVPILFLQNKANSDEHLVHRDFYHLTRSFDELNLLHLPDESLDNFTHLNTDLSSFAQKFRSSGDNNNCVISDSHLSNVCLPLLQISPEVDTALVDTHSPAQTELPLLKLDFSHPVFFSAIPTTLNAAEPKLQPLPTEPVSEDHKVSYAEGPRRRRREAKNGILPSRERVVLKTVETQTDNRSDDFIELTEEEEDINVFNSGVTPNKLINDKDLAERPVFEWSPAVAAFHRQVEDVEADMACKQSEGRPDMSGHAVGNIRQLQHQGLSAVEIEMIPIHKVINQVSAAVQTDNNVQHTILSDGECEVRDSETQVGSIILKDASTQSQHIGQDIIVVEDDVTEDSLVDNSNLKAEVESGDKVELKDSTSLPADLPQVLAPHLFFGLKFSHGSQDDTMHGDRDFISVVDIPSSSLNDLPSVDMNDQKERMKVVLEEPLESGNREEEDNDIVSEKICEKESFESGEVSDDKRVLHSGDNVTTCVLSEEPTYLQSGAISVSQVGALPIKDARLKTQLVAMMEQLDAIEATAKHVENEFKDSQLLLHTIDQLQAVEEVRKPYTVARDLQLELPSENISIPNDGDREATHANMSPSPDGSQLPQATTKKTEQTESSDKNQSLVERTGELNDKDNNKCQLDLSMKDSQERQSPVSSFVVDAEDIDRNSDGDTIANETESEGGMVETLVGQNRYGDRVTRESSTPKYAMSQSTWTVARVPTRATQTSLELRPKFGPGQGIHSRREVEMGQQHRDHKAPSKSLVTSQRGLTRHHLRKSSPTLTKKQVEDIFSKKGLLDETANQREELRQWMKRRRAKQHAEFMEDRSRLRVAEAHPFSSQRQSGTFQHRTTEIKEQQRRDHAAERVREAFNLMSNIVTPTRSSVQPDTGHYPSDPVVAVKADPGSNIKSPEQSVGNISLSSGSIMSNIDWDEVDRILDD